MDLSGSTRTLPKFEHSTYRADFGIPGLCLLIEAKYARSSGDFKAMEKEVPEDLVPYFKTPERYREVIVFIYDESSGVQLHDATIRALRSAPGISEVLVVCRSSPLPLDSSPMRLHPMRGDCLVFAGTNTLK
ncbi:hypothetical protein P3T43_002721 [Paraburkholderia sp. GAS41]|uniref:PD-(D/E)XK nuclease domain-containing protein n=1 Tax=Paraburkholderia sp. GAS41 TaxID=3035134 RepID=UPI003D23AE6E